VQRSPPFWRKRKIACCAEVEQGLARQSVAQFESRVIEMFEAEWKQNGRAKAHRNRR